MPCDLGVVQLSPNTTREIAPKGPEKHPALPRAVETLLFLKCLHGVLETLACSVMRGIRDQQTFLFSEAKNQALSFTGSL